jgi:hypothetical protein
MSLDKLPPRVVDFLILLRARSVLRPSLLLPPAQSPGSSEPFEHLRWSDPPFRQMRIERARADI